MKHTFSCDSFNKSAGIFLFYYRKDKKEGRGMPKKYLKKFENLLMMVS